MQPVKAGSPCLPRATISPFASNSAQLKSHDSVTILEKAVRKRVAWDSSTIVISLFHHIVKVIGSTEVLAALDE